MTAILSSNAKPTTISLVTDLSDNPAAVAPAARATGVVYRVFPVQPYGTSQQRYIHNPNAAGSIWATVIPGVTPAVNGEGSFEIAPGGRWADAINSEVRVVFTANAMNITAFER